MTLINKYFEVFGTTQKPMAASLKSLEFCKSIIESNASNSLLDCGSGLSTVFFNLNHPNVITIEDDLFWAGKTKDFVKSYMNLDIEISSIKDVVNQKFDFIFYDFGDMETRIYYLKFIMLMAKKYIYLDDLHIDYYRLYVESVVKKNFNLIILDNEVDEFGRFGGLLELKSPLV